MSKGYHPHRTIAMCSGSAARGDRVVTAIVQWHAAMLRPIWFCDDVEAGAGAQFVVPLEVGGEGIRDRTESVVDPAVHHRIVGQLTSLVSG